MPRAPAVVVPAIAKHTATIIFAHGLGDSGAGWMQLAENYRGRGKFEHVKFVFPNAPNIPITVNFGMSMPGWYDIKGFDDLANASQDEEGILRSRSTLQALIAHEIEKEGIPSNRIVLGGFSQGGAMALVTGLTSTHRLAGIVGMSCYLPIAGRVPELIAAAQPSPSKEVPVQMYHGADDPLVKTAWGVRSKELISELGWKVEMKTYPGLQHSAAEEEIEDLEKWLDGKIGSPGATGGVGASKA